MKKLKILAAALCLYANVAFASIPPFPATVNDIGAGGFFTSAVLTTGCVPTGTTSPLSFTALCSGGAGTSNFVTTTSFSTDAGNTGAQIVTQTTSGQVTFKAVSYFDAGANESRYPTARIYVDYVCHYDSTYLAGVCGSLPINTTVHLVRTGRAHIDFYQTFIALTSTQIVGPSCVQSGDKVTYSIFDFMSGPVTNRDHYRWNVSQVPGWTTLYYSYDSSSITLKATTVNPGDVLSVSIGDCNNNIRTKAISNPGVIAAPAIVKNYCINPSTATTWNVSFVSPTDPNLTYSWDIAASGAGFTFASGTSTTQGPIVVNIGTTPSGYIVFNSNRIVGNGCPNALRKDTIRFTRAFNGTISGTTCINIGQQYTYTVNGVDPSTSITWSLPPGMTPATGTTTTATPSITVNVNSAISYGTINALPAAGSCAGSISSLTNIITTPVLTAITGPICVARNATVTFNATASGFDNIIWTSLSGATSTSSTSFTTNVPATFTGGTVSAVASRGGCNSPSVSYNVGWNPTGINLTTLTASKTCLNNGISDVVTLTTDPGYTTYNWNLPSGWSGTSTTNTITYTTNGTGGTVTVTGTNGTCGSTNAKSITLSVSAPVTVTNSGIVNGVVTLSVPTGNTYQWLINGIAITGATNNFLILPVTGVANNTYCVNVTTSAGCISQGCTNSTNLPAARLAVSSDETTLSVNPNPSSKTVNIVFGSALAGQAYTVINMNGQILTSGTLVSDSSIDVSTWADGMYILKTANTSVKIQVSK